MLNKEILGMKRKLIYLPDEYSKDVVENINGYFDMGYEIEEILNAEYGYYIIFALRCNNIRKQDSVSVPEYKYTLIEEKNNPEYNWVSTNTNEEKYS